MNKLPANFNLNEPFETSDYQPPPPATPSTPRNNNSSSNNHNMSKDHNENNASLNLSRSLSSFGSPEIEFDGGKIKIVKDKAKSRKGSAPSFGSSSTSNIYGSLSSKTSTFYVTDSVDVDSGIFTVNDKSTSSPDNSNLNLSTNSNSSSVNSDLKRRSIAGINSSGSRPNDPPPPPPPPMEQRQRRSGATSWYTECELFKPEIIHTETEDSVTGDEKTDKTSSSWYTESGLYQTSNTSVARLVEAVIVSFISQLIHLMSVSARVAVLAFQLAANAVRVAMKIRTACS